MKMHFALLALLAFPIASAFSDDTKPETPPTFLNVTDVGDGTITVSVNVPVTVQETFTYTVNVNGMAETRTGVRTVTRHVVETKVQSVKDCKLLTVDGKAAEWKQAKGKIVLSTTNPEGLSANYKKLFAADVLVIVTPDPAKVKKE